MRINNLVLKPVLMLATTVMRGPIGRIAKDTTEKVAKAVADSLSFSEGRMQTLRPETEEAKAMHTMISHGVRASKEVAEAIAGSENTKEEVINVAIASLRKWQKADNEAAIDLDGISATLRNAITAIQSSRDDLAIPLLENINGRDLQTTLREILPNIVNIDLENLLDRLKTDESEEGMMIKELLLIVISAINAGRKEMLKKLEEIGLGNLVKRK